MAGLAALMTRKKRDRRRELELRQQMQDSGSIAELTGKQAEEAMERKAAHETIKKMLIGKELLRQKSKQSFDALSQVSYGENEDGSPKYGPGSAYNAIYIGLVLMCIGAVITFVGLGEKGFKTVELKLIGPVLMLVGFSCITAKIVMCTFPNLFKYPDFIKNRKLADTDGSNLMEKGVSNSKRNSQSQNGRVSKNGSNDPSAKASPNFVSPRVTLQSSKKANRPRSTIPNYIEDSSADEDDFDPGRSRPHSNRYNSVEVTDPKQNGMGKAQQQSNGNNLQADAKSQNSQNSQTPNLQNSQTQNSQTQSQSQQSLTQPSQQNQEEILLTPKALML